MTNDYGNLELHQVLLAAMKDIDKICREHGLKYYLYAGTLLGAFNHKGFIPWDDDVDISMYPDEYQVFASVIETKYKDKFFLKTFENTPDHYSKLNKLQILGAEVVYQDGSRENVFIDISLFHHAPDSKLGQWIQCKELEFWDKVIGVKAGRIIPVSWRSKFLLLPFSKLDKEIIGKRLNRIMSRYDHKSTKWNALMIHMLPNPYTGVSGYYNDFVPSEICKNPQDILFENCFFMAYSDPEVDLLRRYGADYAKPYPEEKRVSKHAICGFIISEELRGRMAKGDE